MSYSVVERIAKQIGIKITRRAVGEGMSRWLPMIGALGVGAYAYYDTGQVAATTIAMMNGEFEMAEADAQEATAIPSPRKPSAMRRVIDKATTRKRGKPHAE